MQSAIMDNVLHPLDDKMSLQRSTFSRRLFPLRRAKKHFRSPSDCPPLQCLLPHQHQPLALRFPLSTCLQSVIYLFLQRAPMWFHPLHTHTHKWLHKASPPQTQALAPSVGLVLVCPSFIIVCFLMQNPSWIHKVIHSHNHSFIHSFTHT